MKEIKTKKELDEILSETGEDKLVILKYSATWCQPCQILGGIIKEIEPTLEKVIFVNVDCDEAEDELIKLNCVKSIPHLVYYRDGLVLHETIGCLEKEELLRAISGQIDL